MNLNTNIIASIGKANKENNNNSKLLLQKGRLTDWLAFILVNGVQVMGPING
jgi:hypothetical protein